ncbi:response regulator transcription factor [Agromyces sp. Marseille-P2726]|uniref:response regulator transcription factor n=1 Tax=Agromyces sp. Marseille-P2726 TaxID=2709132 RepID=UPI001C2CE895|nr:helix-turn-helix transcriptional regulator [Agromyces sp. Marseille-P2726]
MSSSSFRNSWIDLTAELLSRPLDHDPMVEICHELATYFSSDATGTIDFTESRARFGVYETAVDAAPYVPQIGDHPLALLYRSTGDPHTHSLMEAQRFTTSWSRTLLQSLRDQNIKDFVFVPLRPRQNMDHRWLGVSSAEPLQGATDDLELLRPLIAALDAHCAVLAECFVPGSVDANAVADARLTSRELAVLGLVARGLTTVAIASRLRISPRTVSKHQENLYRKLHVNDRVSAVILAHELRVLQLPSFTARAPAIQTIEAEVATHDDGTDTSPATVDQAERSRP